MSRRVVTFVVGLVALTAAVIAVSSRSTTETKRVYVTVREATNVVKGQRVRQGGVKVGQIADITPVQGGRAVKLALDLDDSDGVWPLPTGTKMSLRWGGTANFGDRYIDLVRGKGAGAMVAEGGTFPTKSFALPVDIDQLLADFPARRRAELQTFLKTAGPALGMSKRGLQRTLAVGPEALGEANAVTDDLNADTVALRNLVESTGSVVNAVQTAQPGLRSVLEGAAGTFDAIAAQSTATKALLQAAPRTLQVARTTLGQADPVLDRAQDVTGKLAPGVAELRRTTAPLTSVLRQLRTAGPDATVTLATARRATPSLQGLLGTLQERSPQLESIGKQATEQLSCLRPFTPDVMSFFTNWGDFLSGTDNRDHMLRATVQQISYAPANALPYNADQISKLLPGIVEYGFPRPPGYNAGQPWFQPQCGAGEDALDPSKDAEIRTAESRSHNVPRLAPIAASPRAKKAGK